MDGGTSATDDELIAEQSAFYEADAESYDEWLCSLLDEENGHAVARSYRSGRAEAADLFRRRAPLGRTLEIACGGGLLAELYMPYSSSAVLVDSSPTSLAIACRRLSARANVRFVVADIFDWEGDGDVFDTIIFSAWLHHVPHSRFGEFWQSIGNLLAHAGRVVFDFPDARLGSDGWTEVPEEPAEDYAFYAPRNGISIRDHRRRRWRVVHNMWDPEELATGLRSLGWPMTLLGASLFDHILWAEAIRENFFDKSSISA